jgi:YVTN family beta-propeller protein
MSTNIDVVNIYIENSQNGIAITPHGRIVITPNDTRAYVINSVNNNVSVIDAFSNKVINTIYLKDTLKSWSIY